jgi:hypothetical protein
VVAPALAQFTQKQLLNSPQHQHNAYFFTHTQKKKEKKEKRKEKKDESKNRYQVKRFLIQDHEH